MVDRTSLIWIDHNLYHSFFMTWLTVPAKYGTSVNEKSNIFELLNTCMEISVSLSCLLVHELPYQTAVVCCNSVFCSGSSHMDHCTISYSRVGLAQAHPNYEHMHLTNSTKTQQYITYAYVLNEVYVLNNHVRLITRFYGMAVNKYSYIWEELTTNCVNNASVNNMVMVT